MLARPARPISAGLVEPPVGAGDEPGGDAEAAANLGGRFKGEPTFGSVFTSAVGGVGEALASATATSLVVTRSESGDGTGKTALLEGASLTIGKSARSSLILRSRNDLSASARISPRLTTVRSYTKSPTAGTRITNGTKIQVGTPRSRYCTTTTGCAGGGLEKLFEMIGLQHRVCITGHRRVPPTFPVLDPSSRLFYADVRSHVNCAAPSVHGKLRFVWSDLQVTIDLAPSGH